MERFLQYLFDGLSNGAVYALLALGLVVIFRGTGQLNFAQGEMGMFSTFIVWQLHDWGLARLVDNTVLMVSELVTNAVRHAQGRPVTVRLVRGEGTSVGVISVDPSSPFTKGALLGDRIRLADHFLDREVFIRSMGTRGHLGGLAETTLQAALVLDAAGNELFFL